LYVCVGVCVSNGTTCEGSFEKMLGSFERIEGAFFLTETHYNTLQHTSTHCNSFQHTATPHQNASHSNTLNHTTTGNFEKTYSFDLFFGCMVNAAGSNLVATHCNTLQYAATHCNTLQHTWPFREDPCDRAFLWSHSECGK